MKLIIGIRINQWIGAGGENSIDGTISN